MIVVEKKGCEECGSSRGQVRPPLNKKLFPVHRPGGLKRADWNFLSFFFFFFFFLSTSPPPPPVNYSLEKKEKSPDLPTGTDYSHQQETLFYLRVALGVSRV